MADIVEIFADGTVVERDFTPEEIAQREQDEKDFFAAEKAKKDKETKRAALLEKLGITEEEARLLLG